MNLEKQDVNVESSTTTEEVVEEQDNQSVPSPQGNEDVQDGDEEEQVGEQEDDRVSIENRLAEERRVLADTKKERQRLESLQNQAPPPQASGYTQPYPQQQVPQDPWAEQRSSLRQDYIDAGIDENSAKKMADKHIAVNESMVLNGMNAYYQNVIRPAETRVMTRQQNWEMKSFVTENPDFKPYVERASEILEQTPIERRMAKNAIRDALVFARGEDISNIKTQAREEGKQEGIGQRRIIRQTGSAGSSRTSVAGKGSRPNTGELGAIEALAFQQNISVDEAKKRYMARKKQRENANR